MNNTGIDLLDAKTLGQRLRLSRRQIYRLMNEKKIPAPLRIGGVWRWPESQIADWLAAGAPSRNENLWAEIAPFVTVDKC
jgi:excisionase family DNA binding protein